MPAHKEEDNEDFFQDPRLEKRTCPRKKGHMAFLLLTPAGHDSQSATRGCIMLTEPNNFSTNSSRDKQEQTFVTTGVLPFKAFLELRNSFTRARDFYISPPLTLYPICCSYAPTVSS